ncbi:MAG: hypothetical protein AAF346_01325 [Pseudomonadota bacterium]
MVSGEVLNLETALAQLYELQLEFDALEAAASNAQQKLSSVVEQLETLSKPQPIVELVEDELVDIDFTSGSPLPLIGNLAPTGGSDTIAEDDDRVDAAEDHAAPVTCVLSYGSEPTETNEVDDLTLADTESQEISRSDEFEEAGPAVNVTAMACGDVVSEDDLSFAAGDEEACSSDSALEANVQDDSLVAGIEPEADAEGETISDIDLDLGSMASDRSSPVAELQEVEDVADQVAGTTEIAEIDEQITPSDEATLSEQEKVVYLSAPAILEEDALTSEDAIEARISEDNDSEDKASDEPELLDEQASEELTSEENEDSIVIAALETNKDEAIDAAALEGDDTVVVELLNLASDEDCHGSMHQPIAFDGAAAAAELKQNASAISKTAELAVEAISDIEPDNHDAGEDDTTIAGEGSDGTAMEAAGATETSEATVTEIKTEAETDLKTEEKSEPTTDTVVPFPTTQEKTVKAARKPKRRRLAVAFTGIAASIAACAFALQMPEFQHLQDLPQMDQLLQRLSELKRFLA